MQTRRIVATLAATAALTSGGAANAALTLTAEGIADGFTLSTFISGYTPATYGPLSQGVLPGGNIITGSAFGSAPASLLVFKDVDGQTLADAVSSTPYVFETGNPQYAFATIGSHVYGAQAFGGTYREFFSDGSSVALGGAVASHRSNLGMWGNPVNGHIISSGLDGLVDIDPVTGAFHVIAAVGASIDGVTVSPDGTIAYVELGGTIQSYAIATGALIHTFFTGHAPDGTGVISGGKFDGDIIVNNNDGTLGLLDPDKADGDPLQFVIIATGGTRGDFVSPDFNNGTLFISQTEQIARLSCGPGCAIGGPPPEPGVPEPTSFALLIAAAIAGLGMRRQQKG